jgi:hypothetical protein
MKLDELSPIFLYTYPIYKINNKVSEIIMIDTRRFFSADRNSSTADVSSSWVLNFFVFEFAFCAKSLRVTFKACAQMKGWKPKLSRKFQVMAQNH